MLTIDSCMSAHDAGQILVSHLTWPYSQATPSNGYAQLFWGVLPRWALMPDTQAAQGYWLGNDTLYTRGPPPGLAPAHAGLDRLHRPCCCS